MDHESVEDAFDTLMRVSAVPLLKERGFRKRKLTFARERDGMVDVVNVQRSAGNGHRSIRFYVNCGVYSAAFDRIVGRNPRERPSEVDCQFRCRIEHLAPGFGPHVTVHADTDVHTAAEDMRAALTTALDAMEAMSSPDDIARAALSYIDFDVFRYRLATGDLAAARDQYARARAEFGAEDRWPRLVAQFREAEDVCAVSVSDAGPV